MKQSSKLIYWIVLPLLLVGISGCKTGKSNKTTRAASIEENLTYQGNKARIVVGTIKSKAAQCSTSMANSIGEMLSTSLSNVGNLIVLANQDEVAELAEELQMVNSGYVEQGSGAEMGLMEGADIMIIGSVTAFEPDAGGSSAGMSKLKDSLFGKVGLSTKEAKISIDIKLVDIRTRRILKAIPIKVSSSNWGANAAVKKWGRTADLGTALGTYSNTPMEDAIREAIGKSVDKISRQIPQSYYRYQGQGNYQENYRN
ncbi:MAG: CsgG/HfaB family protein [Gammaproteobacteria bacterium]|nr:CsgG/HfaB family protein [Gammaproteobacteria bacterium]MDH5629172.1 CsgG/HfaB family protein [Gammaproteobacteria bacterium]